MPTLFQIASYARLFQLLRGRKPTAEEVSRYFEGGQTGIQRKRRSNDRAKVLAIR